MSDQPEPLAAILAEMRNPPHKWEGFSRADLARLADRIEAAAERERDEDRQLAAIAESDEAFARCARCDRPERAPGNAAAMRDALLKVLECYKSGAIRTEYNDPDSWKHDDELCYLKDDVEAALAAPARNCDKFATADDARDAAKKEFANTMLLDDRQLRAVCDWLFDTAEGGDHA